MIKVSNKEIHTILDRIESCLNFQFEKMSDMRLMYSQIRDIQDRHWNYLYLGYLSEIGMLLDKLRVKLK